MVSGASQAPWSQVSALLLRVCVVLCKSVSLFGTCLKKRMNNSCALVVTHLQRLKDLVYIKCPRGVAVLVFSMKQSVLKFFLVVLHRGPVFFPIGDTSVTQPHCPAELDFIPASYRPNWKLSPALPAPRPASCRPPGSHSWWSLSSWLALALLAPSGCPGLVSDGGYTPQRNSSSLRHLWLD